MKKKDDKLGYMSLWTHYPVLLIEVTIGDALGVYVPDSNRID